MSDEELRRLEREIAVAPHHLELRREHAGLLARLGREEQALSALDLAWRLGADELQDELAARLAARRIEAAGLGLGYVPAGPFAMGSEEIDDDCSPVHVVDLSAFWVAERPIAFGEAARWPEYPHWVPEHDWPGRRQWEQAQVPMDRDVALGMLAHLNRASLPSGLPGAWALPTEAQWERVFRACYLRPDGACPYGARRSRGQMLEWTADRYHPGWYARSPRRDPTGPAEDATEQTWVVRGVPYLPDPEFALYREAAKADGRFDVGGPDSRWVAHEQGIALRPVFNPA